MWYFFKNLVIKKFFILIYFEQKKQLNKFTRKDGFSLIELVVVVAVLAVLSAIAIPSFSDIRKKAMITVAKQNLISIIKECNLAYLESGDPKFSDIVSWNSSNAYGDSKGLSFSGDGFTYDTAIDSNDPIRSTDSCMSIAAKSNTTTNSGSTYGSLPHFEIKYDSSTGTIEKNCIVDSVNTFNKGTCITTNASGSQW